MVLRSWLVWGASASVCAAACMTLFSAACSGEILIEPPSVDAGANDATTNNMNDASQDGGTDAPVYRDVANVDVEQPSINTFLPIVQAAICDRYDECCTVIGLDAGPATFFDKGLCKGRFTQGWNGSATGLQAAIAADAGNIAFNATAALNCVRLVRTFQCPEVNGIEMKQIEDSCFGALSGTVAANGACNVSIECSTGLYCDTGDSGATTGTCKPVLPFDAGCAIEYNQVTTGTLYTSEQCSDKGKGAACEVIDPDTSLDAKCGLPQLPNGTTCYSNSSCASNLCEIDFVTLPTCVNTSNILPSGTCEGFQSPVDAH